jgi:hypothetical protein
MDRIGGWLSEYTKSLIDTDNKTATVFTFSELVIENRRHISAENVQ